MRLKFKRLYEELGHDNFGLHLQEALHDGLSYEDFSVRDLAEECMGREFVRMIGPQKSGGFSNFNLLEAGGAVNLGTFSNITGQIVYNRLIDAFNNEQFIFSRLVETIPTEFESEKIAGMSRIGDEAETIAEGQSYPRAGFGEDYIETPLTTKRGLIVGLTREAIFFDRTGLILNRAREVGEFLGLNKEKRVIDVVIGVTNNYKWKGTTYNTYNQTTPWANLIGSNALADWTDVDAVEQLFANILDPHTGEPVLISPNTIAVCPELLHTARRIINATEIEARTNSAAVVSKSGNTLDNYTIVSSRLMRARMSAASIATTTWHMGDFRRAFGYMQNWPITVVQAPSNSDAEFDRDIVAQWKASERGAAAVIEPRAVAKSQAASL